MYQLWAVVAGAFQIDLRALALFRIFFGIIVGIDVLFMLPWVRFFFADTGFYTRTVAQQTQEPFSPLYSLFFLTGDETANMVLLLLFLLCLLCFSLGYKTRLFSFLTWYCYTSYHLRLGIGSNDGDEVVQNFLFIAMFLPTHRRWSIDAWLARGRGNTGRRYTDTSTLPQGQPPSPITSVAVSMATVFVFIQLIVIYVSTGVFKSHHTCRTDLLGNQLFASLDVYATRLGRLTLDFPSLNRALTWVTIYIMEGVLPLVLLFPFFLPVVRTIIGMSFIGFHFGIYMTAEVGIFPWVCIFAWVLVLPPWVWDRLEALLGRAQRLFLSRRKVSAVLYPGVVAVIAALVCYRHVSSNAAVACALVVYPSLAAGAYVLQPCWVRRVRAQSNMTHDPQRTVAASDIQMLSPPRRPRCSTAWRYVKTAIPNLICLVALWAILDKEVAEHRVKFVHPVAQQITYHINSKQQWKMFAPMVPFLEAWPLVEAQLEDGGTVDVFKAAISLHGYVTRSSDIMMNLTKPDHVFSSVFPYFRHRRMSTAIAFKRDSARLLRMQLLRFLCREYNGPVRQYAEAHGAQLSRAVSVTLMLLEQRTKYNSTHVWELNVRQRILQQHVPCDDVVYPTNHEERPV